MKNCEGDAARLVAGIENSATLCCEFYYFYPYISIYTLRTPPSCWATIHAFYVIQLHFIHLKQVQSDSITIFSFYTHTHTHTHTLHKHAHTHTYTLHTHCTPLHTHCMLTHTHTHCTHCTQTCTYIHTTRIWIIYKM